MAINYKVAALVPTSTTQNTQSVWLVLQDDQAGAYKRYEARGVDGDLNLDQVQSYIDANINLATLWSVAVPATAEDWNAAGEAFYRAYYASIPRAIAQARRNGGTLGMALAAGLTAIGAIPAKQTEFLAYAAWTELSSPAGIQEQRDALFLMLLWANTNLSLIGV